LSDAYRHLPGELEDGRWVTRVVISCFGEEVAPLFNAARRFRYWEMADGEARRYRELTAEEPGALLRIRLLREVRAHVLICNGIEQSVRQMLEADGYRVINGVLGSAADALFGFLAGQIAVRPPETSEPEPVQPHTADLVAWTEQLFRQRGWEIRRVQQKNLYPIDLLATRSCPVCRKGVRVAVCCGAHAYQVDEEIRELNRVSASGYHARVYVHHAVPGVARTCRDFSIELLDPDDFSAGLGHRAGPLPPLKGRIAGHDQLRES